MTLIVALNYKDGSVLPTDSRVMVGPIKRDRARKLVHLNEHIAVAAAGLLGAIDDIIRPVKEICNSRSISVDDVSSQFSDISFNWFKKNSDKL